MEGELLMSEEVPVLSRRSFVKAAGALGALAVAGSGVAAVDSMFGESTPQAEAEAVERVVWSQCNVNCGSRCIFQWHVQDGEIQYMESDNTGNDDLQARACLRGRSMRRWVNSPDRLLYPMKRAGNRGEGKFEQISWDEAIQTIANKLKYTIDQYGNESVYINYGTGMYSVTGNTINRLMNCLGGYLSMYGDYSTAQITAAAPFTYGSKDGFTASSMTEAENSDLLIMFGNSPADTRMGGANIVWDFAHVREAGVKIINIDYRYNETNSGTFDEWLPIRTGTDAALVNAIAHELIVNDQVDIDFLHTYCVGYDEQTMPDSAKGQNKSYKDYIMGTGYDNVEKTPEWAAPITQTPASRIRELTEQIAAAKALFVCQGWGPQRHSNGENTSRAIFMLPILTGMIGLPGTNLGTREAMPDAPVASIPAGTNLVTESISCYQWLNAIDHGDQMTATKDGVKGIDRLKTGIKFLWNYAGNCITNQHGDINLVHDILQDESKCEFIVVTDTVLTDSAKYADILLPDAMRAEQLNMSTNGYSEWYTGVCVGGPAQDVPGECRPSYDVNADIADRFGVKSDFTQGRTQDEWIEYLYNQGRAADPQLPTYEDLKSQGLYKRALAPSIGLEKFRNDPVGNPLSTPSGKIEIYSESLATIADTWELDKIDVITPIPIFDPGFDGYGSVTDDYPLYCSGFHYKSRTHSSFGFIDVLEQANRQQMWINPIDAGARDIEQGDTCAVKSPAGEIRIEAKVTQRIIPGTVAIPQGAWHNADMSGDRIDTGGCINTLTTYHPSPLAKGDPQHSIIVQVAKA